MYKLIGADQKEYGPVSEEQMRQWIAQGRINSQTKVRSETGSDWQAIGTLPEFASAFPSATAAPPPLPSTPAPSKTSGLAISSLVCGVLGFCGITAIAGLILGIIALRKINRSQGRLTGQGLAIAGICVSAAMLLMGIPIMAGMMLPALAKAKQRAQAVACLNNVKQLNLAAIMYASDNNNKFPSADQWCDTAKKYFVPDKAFLCAGGDANKRCHYAFNAELSGIEEAKITEPGRTVLFFEIDGGWNVSGGQELMLKHPRHGRTVTVGFADGHVESVTNPQTQHWRWTP